jgi:hypothetical protein
MSGETEQHVSGWTVDTLREFLHAEIASVRAECLAKTAELKELQQAHRAGDKEAVTKAFDAASELSKSHNDLLRKMEKLTESFATKQDLGRLTQWQAKVSGGLLVVAAVGVANFVKVWTG